MAAGGEVPVGTVTVLLTGAESSVPQCELVARLVVAAGGTLLPERAEVGGLVAVFASAVAAVTAAAEAQREVAAAAPWPPFAVAVHTGEVRRWTGSFAAVPVIARCARLRACAHGGQVIVSDATAGLVADDLPPELDVVEIGVVRLHDRSRPTRLWQLRAPGLRTVFPPSPCLAAATNNLPTATASLVGREDALAELGELLRTNRLVTLTGAGGTGKTRLALAATTTPVDRHAGGTWWVDLAELVDPAQVVERVVATLGLDPSALRDPLAALRVELGSVGDVLIVLDNAEHLVDAVSTLVADVLAACPDARFVVTSREPLGVAGETVWGVPPLSVPPDRDVRSIDDLLHYGATRLFVERARAVRPNLEVDERACQLVAAICRDLDGLPLAIELAAARVRTVPLDRVAAELERALSLVSGGTRGAGPRQQTLSASIAWSVDRLDDVSDAVFRRLAVFHGPFTIEAAEAVVADGDLVEEYDVLDAIARLVDKSLVQLEDRSGCYRLLEPLRRWALERLTERGELEATRRRHADWRGSWAEEVAALRHGIDATAVVDSVPDLIATLEWAKANAPEAVLRICAGLRRFLSLLGASACHRLVDWVIDLDRSPHDATLWARAVEGLTTNALMLGRPDVVELVPAALAELDAAGVPPGFGLRLVQHMADITAGNYTGMAALCDDATRDGSDLDTKWLAAGVALFATASGDRLVAHRHLDLLEEVLVRWGLDVTPDTAGFGLGAAIDLATLEGRLGDARGLAGNVAAGHAEHVFPAALAAALVGYVVDDPAVMEIASRWTGHEPPSRFVSAVRGVRSLVALGEGASALAADHAVAAWDAAAPNGILRVTLVTHTVPALLAAGQLDRARDLLGAWAADVAAYGNPPRPLATVHHGTALVALEQGDHTNALSAAHALLDLAHNAGFVLLTIDALTMLSQLSASRGNELTAARLAGSAAAARSRCGYRRLLVAAPSVVDAFTAQLATALPTAFAEGEALDLDASVELARRMRGERRRPAFGWESLTPTERKVADLTAEGLTNDEIAARLVMSPKTVRTHLTRIFAKLGVHNRTQLASAHVRGTA